MSPKSSIAILILAAGSGTRMKRNAPKQFLKLNGQPVLFHTLNNILSYSSPMDIYIVTQDEYKPLIEKIVEDCFKDENIQIVLGGKERFNSTQYALKQIPDYKFILIHDAARPFVEKKVIRNGIDALQNHDVVIPVIPVIDSIRQLSQSQSKSLARDSLRAIQTPQFFNGPKLKEVFSKMEFQSAFTDDASVMEYAGYEVFLIEGNPENIKITYPMDLVIAEYILNHS